MKGALPLIMPWWMVPTTADFGMLVAAPSVDELFAEAAKGMQQLVMSPDAAESAAMLPRQKEEWRVPATFCHLDRTFVRWLDELIYQAEGEGKWLVDVDITIDNEAVNAQVEWVDAELVIRDVEIKATTRHELSVSDLQEGDVFPSLGEAPEIYGPSCLAHVVFDI